MTLPCALELPRDPRSPGRARRFVSTELRDVLDHDQLDCAVLVVSELVTNAVLHAGTPCRVELAAVADVLQLRVTDGAASLPRRRLEVSEELTGGRGLQILERLCLRWGVDPIPSRGKVVWAEFPR